MGRGTTVEEGQRSFTTTRWSMVLAAADEGSAKSRAALAALCERYWYPVYAHFRRRRHDPDAARDLTQGFFARLLEKRTLRLADPSRGRFRAFLKVSADNFLAHDRRGRMALKRGGGKTMISIDLADAESRYRLEPSHDHTPEILFERSWARSMLAGAWKRLAVEHAAPRARERLRHLEPFLTDAAAVPYRQVAAELRMTEQAVKVAVHRLRRRFGQALRDEVLETIGDPAQVDDEIRRLLNALEPPANDS